MAVVLLSYLCYYLGRTKLDEWALEQASAKPTKILMFLFLLLLQIDLELT